MNSDRQRTTAELPFEFIGGYVDLGAPAGTSPQHALIAIHQRSLEEQFLHWTSRGMRDPVFLLEVDPKIKNRVHLQARPYFELITDCAMAKLTLNIIQDRTRLRHGRWYYAILLDGQTAAAYRLPIPRGASR
jgi:hypothetical protein